LAHVYPHIYAYMDLGCFTTATSVLFYSLTSHVSDTHCHLGTPCNFLILSMVFLTISKSCLSLCALIITSLLTKVFMTIMPHRLWSSTL